MGWLPALNHSKTERPQRFPSQSYVLFFKEEWKGISEYLPSNLPHIQDQASIQHVLTDLQSLVVILLPAKLWGF